MLGEMLAELSKVDAWIDSDGSDIYKTQPLAQDWARVAKIGEEFGEAVNELILFTGQNPRKQQTDSIQPLLGELADVVITAICAMIHFTKDGAQVGGILVDKTHAISARMVEAKVKARRTKHPDSCRPWKELGESAHDMCPECQIRWCCISPLCPRLTFNRHPDNPFAKFS